MNDDPPCDVVVAQFVFGAQRCGEPATTTTRCEVATCRKRHPVCEAHAETARDLNRHLRL